MGCPASRNQMPTIKLVVVKDVMGTMEDRGVLNPYSSFVGRGGLGFRQVYQKSQLVARRKKEHGRQKDLCPYRAWPLREPSDLGVRSPDAGRLRESAVWSQRRH